MHHVVTLQRYSSHQSSAHDLLKYMHGMVILVGHASSEEINRSIEDCIQTYKESLEVSNQNKREITELKGKLNQQKKYQCSATIQTS